MSEWRQSIKPTYNHEETGDRFTVRVTERGKTLSDESIPDPFINTTIRPRGWRVALAVLLRRYSVSVHVSGDSEIIEDVTELDDDYKGAPDSTRRAEWDASIERGLRDFAAVASEHSGGKR